MSRKREVLNKFAREIKFILYLTNLLPKSLHLFIFKLIRNMDGYLAIFLRYICLKKCAAFCGDNVSIFSGVYIYNLEKLHLGNNVSIHPMCYINASGIVKIGNDVSIAHNSTIMSEEHIFDDKNIPIKDQGCEYIQTVIMDNVWIGSGCRVLAGSTIESGSVVAAGAVVKNRVPSNVVVGGVPAKIIKERV